MAVSVALRNLFESRTRLFIGIGGVALAIALVLVLDGVFAAAMKQVTVYIDNTPFDLIVSQKGVRNMHMTSSQFPRFDIDKARAVPGVRSVDPVLFTTAYLVVGDQRSLVYLIGYENGKSGGPWTGGAVPRELGVDQIVIDERVASALGVSVDDTVTVLGKDFTVAGLTSGTVSITNSIAFVRLRDFEAAARLQNVASFGLVTLDSGQDPAEVARRISRRTGGLTVMSKTEFANSERSVVSDMATDILRFMNIIALLIGLAVVGLSAYTSTLAKRGEFGVLKALGTGNLRLFAIVCTQSLMSVALGLVLAVGISLGLTVALRLVQSTTQVLIEGSSVLRVGVGAALVAIMGSALPIVVVARIEPAEVFRR